MVSCKAQSAKLTQAEGVVSLKPSSTDHAGLESNRDSPRLLHIAGKLSISLLLSKAQRCVCIKNAVVSC